MVTIPDFHILYSKARFCMSRYVYDLLIMPEVELALFTTFSYVSLNPNSLSTHMPRSSVVSSNLSALLLILRNNVYRFVLPRCIHLHLLALKSSCQSLDHFYLCHLVVVLYHFGLWFLYRFLVSSVNIFLADFTQSGRSFIKIMISSGPRIPLVTVAQLRLVN